MPTLPGVVLLCAATGLSQCGDMFVLLQLLPMNNQEKDAEIHFPGGKFPTSIYNMVCAEATRLDRRSQSSSLAIPVGFNLIDLVTVTITDLLLG